jgi:hypothetical protein
LTAVDWTSTMASMTSKLDSSMSDGDLRRSRAYYRDFFPAMLAYCLLLPLVIAFGDLQGQSPLRFVWAMLPVLPVLVVVWAVWRHLNRQDEYQRLVLLQSLAVGFAGCVVAAVVMGFLGLAGLGVSAGPWMIFGAGMACWAAAAVAQTMFDRQR